MRHDKEKTKVIFRVLEGDVIALFPELPGNYKPHTCDSYMHVGQHSSADINGLINSTRLATLLEYADLAAELTGIGYNLEIRVRESNTMREARYAALKRFK